jgi:long-chain acyl-CoA synthetase
MAAMSNLAGMLTDPAAAPRQDGYFYIVDRNKELVIRGGFNVYPREIEEVLYEHRAVREAAVLGVPDDSLAEELPKGPTGKVLKRAIEVPEG